MCSDYLDVLNQASIVTGEILAVTEVLWAASKLDMKRLENRPNDDSEETNTLIYDCRKRINEMERKMKIKKTSIKDTVLGKMQKFLKKALHPNTITDQISSIEMCVNLIQSLEDRSYDLTESACELKNVGRICSLVKEM